MTRFLTTSIKLLITSTLILGIGAVFLVISPKEEGVQKARADIYSLTGIDHEHDFDRAMESLGIRPRAYDFNGNVMFFGTSRIQGSSSARETALLVQKQLVEKGVNQKNYLDEDLPKLSSSKINVDQQKQIHAFSEAMLEGELVPIRKDNEVYEMASIMGFSPKDFGRSIKQGNRNSKPIDEFSKGYRYVEVRQKPGSNIAEILAVWTNNEFDSRKMKNDSRTQQSPPDSEIPSCVGCKRVRRVQALDKSEPYNLNKWTTNSSMSQSYAFYLSAMKNRGWRASEKQELLHKVSQSLPELQHLGGKGLSFEKDGKVIEITLTPRRGGGTDILSLEQYGNMQANIMKK